MNVSVAESDLLTCPLCVGAGQIARREMLRLAGVDGALEAIGPRLAEMLNERGLGVLAKTKELVEATLRRDQEVVAAQVRHSVAREHEGARLALERELEKARVLASKAHERSETVAGTLALAQKELTAVKDELTRLKNTAAKKGEAGEADFVEAMRPFRHIKVGPKEASAGDYVISVAVDEGRISMRLLENVALVDVKKDKAIGAGDFKKTASDAKSRGLAVAFLVSTSLRSKHPVEEVAHVDGVLVVATTLEDFVAKLSLLTPYLALRQRLKDESGSASDARQRLGDITDRVIARLRDLEAITKQTRAIQKAASSIDVTVQKTQQEIELICTEARPDLRGADSVGNCKQELCAHDRRPPQDS